MALIGLVVGAAVDVLVLFVVARYLRVPGNTIGKAVLVTLAAFVAGYALGPLLLVSLFVSMGVFFLMLIASLIIRLVLIKYIYRIGFGKAFTVWILTALVSIAVSFLVPF